MADRLGRGGGGIEVLTDKDQSKINEKAIKQWQKSIKVKLVFREDKIDNTLVRQIKKRKRLKSIN